MQMANPREAVAGVASEGEEKIAPLLTPSITPLCSPWSSALDSATILIRSLR